MKEWKQRHENKHLIKWPPVLGLFFLHESAEETPICSQGSDGAVNSFKNSELTEKTETKYLCPAVFFLPFAFGCL